MGRDGFGFGGIVHVKVVEVYGFMDDPKVKLN